MSTYICWRCGAHCGPGEADLIAHSLQGCVRPLPWTCIPYPSDYLAALAIARRN